MFRDFIYLDTERVQSIIAQLEKGVLDKVMEGKGSELEGKAGAAAGVLASFLPIGLGGSFSKKHDIQTSKVLHDYAFTVALEALDRESLMLEVENWERKEIPLPDSAFVLVRGSLSILDYVLLKGLAENEKIIGKLTSASNKSQPRPPQARTGNKPQTDVFKQMWTFADAFMGDTVQVRLRFSDDIIFAGPISREFLRENIRDLILKYGGKPKQGWAMLAQIAQVTYPTDQISSMIDLNQSMGKFDPSNLHSLADFFNPVVEVLNVFQEMMASISYPAISVTPIAIYRELESLK
jgi:hypothetical protein